MASIQGIYIALFGRPADPAGLAYYNGVTNNGSDLSGIGNLAGQKEYLDRFAGMGSTEIVQSIYQSLFGRAGEQAGIDFWVGRLTSGAVNINSIAVAILDGAAGNDKITVDAKIAAADLFTNHLDQPSEQKAYDAAAVGRARDYIATIDATHPGTAAAVDALIAQSQTSGGQAPGNGGVAGGGDGGSTGAGGGGSANGTQGSIFILTGPDAGITGHDVINGTAGDDRIYAIDLKSITSNDIIHGGAGNDTLYIMKQSAGTVGDGFSPFIDGVETIRVANGDFLGFDLSHVTGLTTVWSDTNTSYYNASISTTYGIGNGSTEISFASDLSGTDTLLKLALDTGFLANVDSAFDAYEIEHLSIDMLATNFGTVELGHDFTKLVEIDVTGAGRGGIAFQSANVSLAIFDASANKGGVTANLASSHALKTVLGGAGDDTLVLSASAGGYSVATGTGHDTLKFGVAFGNFPLVDADPGAIAGTTSDALVAGMIVVTDFKVANDKLVFTNVAYDLTGAQQNTVSAADSLFAAANLSAFYAHAASATDKLVAFHYGQDTYVFNDADSDGTVSVHDGILKLLGVTSDLTSANYLHG